MSDDGPDFRRLRLVVGVVWASAVGSAALAIWSREWFSVVPSVTAVVMAAGWFSATRRWHAWQAIALDLAYRLGEASGSGHDDAPGG